MPAALVKTLAKKSGKSESEVEKLWKEVKAQLKGQGMKESEGSKFFGTLVLVLKRKLGIKDEAIYLCDNCETQILDEFKYCPECGGVFDERFKTAGKKIIRGGKIVKKTASQLIQKKKPRGGLSQKQHRALKRNLKKARRKAHKPLAGLKRKKSNVVRKRRLG